MKISNAKVITQETVKAQVSGQCDCACVAECDDSQSESTSAPEVANEPKQVLTDWTAGWDIGADCACGLA